MTAEQGRKVFVAHRATGVRVIPEGWLDAWRTNGFCEAEPHEVLAYYDNRDEVPPGEVLQSVAAAAGKAIVEGFDESHRFAIGFPQEAQVFPNPPPPLTAQLV